MKLNVLSLTLLIATTLLFFTSCEKESTITTTNEQSNKLIATGKFKVENEILHFLNEETYRKDAIEIMNLPEQEFQEWEESLGFKSMRSWIMEANDALGDVKSEGQLQNWKQKYGDIVKIEKNEVVPVLHNTYWQSFANRKGEFKIGKTLGKIYPEKTVLIQDGDRSKLPNAKNMNQTDLNKGIIVDLHNDTYTKTIATRSGCPTPNVDEESNGDYRTIYRFIIHEVALTSGDHATVIEISTHADKKNWLGQWRDDYALLQYTECSWEITDNDGINHSVSNQARIATVNVHSIYTYYDCYDDTPPGSYNLPVFNKSKGASTSNRMGGTECLICCGFPSGDCP